MYGRAVQDILGDSVRVIPPSGGLALWIEFSGPQNMAVLVRQALESNVRILPGSLLCDDGSDVPAMRLGYGSLTELEFRQGIERLRDVMSAGNQR